jgi:hypothetical protein
MTKFLTKRVSSLVGYIIIGVSAVVLLGGAFVYQDYAIKKLNKELYTTGVLPAVQEMNKTQNPGTKQTAQPWK